MFDPVEYWKRRNNTEKIKVPHDTKKKKDGTPVLVTQEISKPLRGQDSIQVKSFPKGQPVYTYTKKGENIDINKMGQHRSFDSKGKLRVMNRIESRRKGLYRGFTRKTTKAHPTDHVYRPEKDPVDRKKAEGVAKFIHPEAIHDPTMTNHDRHTLRQAQRKLAKLNDYKPKKEQVA